MKNKFDIRGDITAVFLKRADGSSIETLISTNKLHLVNECSGTWYPSNHQNRIYVKRELSVEGTKRSVVYLHRLIMGSPKGKMIDHIDHNGLNNTDSNLRIVTQTENMQNRSGPNKLSKSGIRGVSWSKNAKKWHAQLSVSKVFHHLGYFDDIHEAEQVAIEARKRTGFYSFDSI